MKREYEAEESTSSSKTKLMDEAEDELLAALGYKVRSSDMAGVAHNLEQLEKAFGFGLEDGISHLASDAVHYNPSEALARHAHFTANQVILESFSGRSSVYVVNFSMKQGMQWPALMQALAVCPGGPLELRLIGIALPPQDDVDSLQEVGWKLAHMAETTKFKFRGVVASSLDDLELR